MHTREEATPMRFELAVAGFEGQRVSVDSGDWRREPFVVVDDRPMPKDPVTDRTVLHRNDGREVTVLVRRSALLVDPVPYVEVDGTPVRLAAALRRREIAWVALPLLLVVGGGLGAVIGSLATIMNLWVIRGAGGRRRFVRTALVTVGAASLFLVVTSASANLANAREREAADQATQRFHAQIDAGECTQIYDEADEQFHTASAQAWALTCMDLRAKAGRVVSTSLQHFAVREIRSPSPPGKYAEASYKTVFTNAMVTETFFWIVSDSPPRLAGYHADSSR